MKLRNANMSVLLVALFASGFTSPIVAADDEQPYQVPQKVQEKARAGASNPYVPAAKKLIQARTWGKTDPFALKMAGNDAAAKIRAAAEAVRDAKDSKEKEDAQKKLAEVLGKSYDEDMTRREKELAQVEERLKKLRDLLERRRAKKQEIIDLQTKVALNEAEGLGFYDGDRGPKSGGALSISGTIDAMPTLPPLNAVFFEHATASSEAAAAQPPAPPAPPAAPAAAPAPAAAAAPPAIK
jgi:hypothetical protein